MDAVDMDAELGRDLLSGATSFELDPPPLGAEGAPAGHLASMLLDLLGGVGVRFGQRSAQELLGGHTHHRSGYPLDKLEGTH